MKTPEDLLRENVRDLISLVKKKNKKEVKEEKQIDTGSPRNTADKTDTNSKPVTNPKA